MFHHGYIFQTMLAEAGPLDDGKVRDHRTIQLLYGVNRAFQVKLQGQWHKVRLCLLDSHVPHYVNGDGDWQLCFYIYPDSHTGHLLKSSILKKTSASLFFHDPPMTGLAVKPSVVRPVLPFELTRLFEKIVYLFTGRQSFSRPDQPLLQKLRHYISESELFSVNDLAQLCRTEKEELADQFKRVTEFDLDSWLLHQRMIKFFQMLEMLDGITDEAIESLSRKAGFSGIGGLDRLFNDLFGIPYSKWVRMTIGSVILTDNRPEFPCFM